jgi:predicted enzyme related to lactoylglutathione lyase
MQGKPSAFIWYELITSDIDAAAKFYAAVIGWTVKSSGAPGMDYRQWFMGEEAVGGLMALPAGAIANGVHPAWLGYLSVADVDASVATITAAGGTLLMPAVDLPGVGRFAMVTDPQQAPFYVMTPQGEGESTSFAPARPGHGGWNELHARDGVAAFDFYSKHFGWRKSRAMDMGPQGIYQIINAGAEDIGAMKTAAAAPRPHWLFYFNVENIDAAAKRVTDAGGNILVAPHEVPGGQFVTPCRDPQGTSFALVGPRVGA